MKDYSKEFDSAIKRFGMTRADFSPAEINEAISLMRQEESYLVEDGSEGIILSALKRRLQNK